MSNFQFLESHWTDLAKLGDLSEKYVYSDPNTSIIKQGILSEVMVKYMLAYDGIAEPAYDNTHANRIRILKNNDLLPREIDKPEMMPLIMLLMKVKKLLIICS